MFHVACYVCVSTGRVVSEMSMCRLASSETDTSQSYYLVGSRDYAEFDLNWLEEKARAYDGNITVQHLSNDVSLRT
jgi:hypothetical protein